MIGLAEILSEGTNFIRVDFYEINNRVYFGELTFFPGSGFTPFVSHQQDLEIGYMRLLITNDGRLLLSGEIGIEGKMC